ncbi:MAG TPA: IS110 family transposase [Chloroflexota bacterium]|nr:IS110 family transposase [Chloroflexota bacterium]
MHRKQITFDYVDTESGEISAGQIRPATRAVLRQWLGRFKDAPHVAFAVEACTGWRFAAEELHRAGVEPHLAEPADTATLRGRKKRAKTDRADARHLRDLLVQQRLPEAWIPPRHVLEARTLARLYIALIQERTGWQQRIHAQLYHQGVPEVTDLRSAEGRAAAAAAELSSAGQQVVAIALSAVARLDEQLVPLRRQLEAIGTRQPAVVRLRRHFGIGRLLDTIIWAELGDCRRFSNSGQAVRFAGLDVTVWSSDAKRARGHLARQGSPELRWALFEAAKCAHRTTAPDYAAYVALRDRLDSTLATLTIARKLVRRCYHDLRELDPAVWQSPPADEPLYDAA